RLKLAGVADDELPISLCPEPAAGPQEDPDRFSKLLFTGHLKSRHGNTSSETSVIMPEILFYFNHRSNHSSAALRCPGVTVWPTSSTITRRRSDAPASLYARSAESIALLAPP